MSKADGWMDFLTDNVSIKSLCPRSKMHGINSLISLLYPTLLTIVSKYKDVQSLISV